MVLSDIFAIKIWNHEVIPKDWSIGLIIIQDFNIIVKTGEAQHLFKFPARIDSAYIQSWGRNRLDFIKAVAA